MEYSQVYLSDLWIIHLVMSNLNWIVTSVVKSLCFCYHVAFLIAYNDQTLNRFEIWAFFFWWVLFNCIYIFLAYSFDKTSKLNFDYVEALKKVSNRE